MAKLLSDDDVFGPPQQPGQTPTSGKRALSDDDVFGEPGALDQGAAGSVDKFLARTGGIVRSVGDFLQAPTENTTAALKGLGASAAEATRGVDLTQTPVDPMGNPIGPAPEVDNNAAVDAQVQESRQASDAAVRAKQRYVQMGDPVAVAGKALEEGGQAAQQAYGEMAQREAPRMLRQQQEISDAKGFLPTVKAQVVNPLGTLGTIAESAPDMLAGLGAARVASSTAGMLGRSAALKAAEEARHAALLEAASNPATFARANQIANEAGQAAYRQTIERYAESAGSATALGAESASSASTTRQQIQDDLASGRFNDEQLKAQSPRYAELRQAGESESTARALLGAELADQNAPVAALWTALAGKLSGAAGAEGKLVAGHRVSAGQALRNVGKEGLEESLQNPGEDYAAFLAKQQYDPNASYDFGGSVAQGLVTGVAQGGAMHGAGYANQHLEAQPTERLAGKLVTNYSADALQQIADAEALPSALRMKAANELRRRAAETPTEESPPAAQSTEAAPPATAPAQGEQLDAAVQRFAANAGIAPEGDLGNASGANVAGRGDGVVVADRRDAGGRRDDATGTPAGSGESADSAALANPVPATQLAPGVPAPVDLRSQTLANLQQQRADAAQELEGDSASRTSDLKAPAPAAPIDPGNLRGASFALRLAGVQPRAQSDLNGPAGVSYLGSELARNTTEIASVNDRLGRIEDGTGVLPRPQPIADEGVMRAAMTVADALHAVTGVRPVMYSDDRSGAPDGFALGGKSYVNATNLDKSIQFTAFHEMFHVAEQRARRGDAASQRFVRVANTIYDMMSEQGKRDYARQYLFKIEGGSTSIDEAMRDPMLRSEMVADFFGKRAEDEKFMRHLAQRDPKGFGQFIRRWIDTLTNLINEFRGKRALGVQDVDQYIRQLSHAKAVAASALIEWRRSNPDLAKQLPGVGESLQLSVSMPEAHEIVPPELRSRIDQIFADLDKRVAENNLSPEARARAETMLQPVLERATAAKPDFDRRVQNIAGMVHGEAKLVKIKGLERSAEKLVYDYNFGVNEIRDLVRATIVVPSLHDVPSVIRAISSNFQVEPGRTKDRFAEPTKAGYRDFMVNVRLPNGAIGEIQVHIPEILAVKKIGHRLYEIARQPNTSPSLTRELAQLQRQVYEAAWDRAVETAQRKNLSLSAKNSSLETGSPLNNATPYRNGRLSGSNANASSPETATGTASTSKNSVPSGNESSAISTSKLGSNSLADEVRAMARNARSSDVGHKRESNGRYVGAPDWVGSSPQNLAVLRKNLKQLALEGEPGRMWYENSSKAILELAGGDREEAEKIVALIAIYSPNATVAANTTMALNAYFQFKAGLPIKAGLGMANRKAEDLLRHNKPWGGVKTNSFYQNLMSEIDPSALKEGVATMDMWMALAFDYGDKKLDQGPKYRFAQTETQRLAKELGWSAHQVQAAIWTAIKARVEASADPRKAYELKTGIATRGEEGYAINKGREYDHYRAATRFGMDHQLQPAEIGGSKYDFSNALNDRAVQMSWEATPGATTGVLPGVIGAPLEQKFEYLVAIQKAMQTADGHDAVAKAIGFPGGVTINGLSAWQGDIGAGAQTLASVALQGAGKNRDFTPASKTLLDTYAAARGLLLNQEAVVYHHPVYDSALSAQNGVHLQTLRPVSEEEMKTLYNALIDKFGTTELAPGYRPDGVRILNFVEGLSNKDFQRGVEEVRDALPDGWGGGQADIGRFRSIGNYIGNDWKENPNGQGYEQVIAAFSPDLPGRLAGIQASIDAVNQDFSKRYGWGAATREDAQSGNAAQARGGDEVSLSKKTQKPAPVPHQQADVPTETKAQAAQRVNQDKFNRFRVIREWAVEHGAKLTPASDVYTTEERMYGRMATRMEDFREKTVKPLVREVQKAGFTMDQVAEYLHARHAEERNKQIASINKAMPDGGSGMLTADAQKILANANPQLARLADKWQRITRDTRDILLHSGIISPEMARAWDQAYKYYVPLKGADEEKAIGTGKGLSVNGKSKRALGHAARDEAIVENILRDHERAIMLAEKNRVAQSAMLMAAEMNDPRLITIDQPQKRAVLMPKYQYDVRLMNLSVQTFDSEQQARNFITQQMAAKAPGATKLTVSKQIADQNVQYMASPMLQPNEANVYVNGHAIRMQFNDDVLAREYTNLGIERLNKILAMSRSVQTYLSRAYTGYNPAFIFRNMFRDFGSGTIKITGNFGAGMTAKAIAEYPKALGHLLRYSWSGRATPDIQSYRDHGGSTGAAYLSDIERIGANVQNAYEEYEGAIAQARKGKMLAAARVASKKTIGALVGWIEHLNMASENALRLALFTAMKKDGATLEEAASAAKNSTVNFNRKGEIGNTLGALYLFFNPNIQDTASVIRTLWRGQHKYQAWAVLGSMVSLAYMLAKLQWGGGDDDYERWKKIPDSVRDKNLVIRTGKESYITIPVPFGFGFFHTLGNTAFALENGEGVNGQSVNVAANFLDHFSPVGNPLTNAKGWDKIDGKAIAELTPGIGFGDLTRDLVRWMVNRNSFGGKIVPESEHDQDKPGFLRINRNTKGTIYDTAARGMSDLTGGGKTYGGAIDVSPETLKFWTNAITGGTGTFISDTAALGGLGARAALDPSNPDRGALAPDKREVPILKDYLKDEMVTDGRRAFWDAAAETKSALADFRRAAKEGDEAGMQRVENANASTMALARAAAGYGKMIKSVRDAEDAISANRTTSLAYKRAAIRQLENEERQIYDDYLHQVTLARRQDQARAK